MLAVIASVGLAAMTVAQAQQPAAAGIKNLDTVIPGHTTVQTWADFVEYGEFNRAFLAATQAAIKTGKTADQALAELKLPDKFAAYQMNGAKDNVPKIYAELGK